MKRTIFVLSFVLLSIFSASAQRVTVGTNLLEWADFVTYNGEIGVALTRHVTVTAGGKFNNTQQSFPENHVIRQNQQMSFYAGLRYWKWYANSGLWYGAKAQYKEFEQSGLWRPALDQGRAAGVGLSVGYTLMLSKHINIEFGAGIWGGSLLEYTLYDCPMCLNVRDRGARLFIAPDELNVSLVFVL